MEDTLLQEWNDGLELIRLKYIYFFDKATGYKGNEITSYFIFHTSPPFSLIILDYPKLLPLIEIEVKELFTSVFNQHK